MGRRGYPAEFRRRVLELVEAGRKVGEVAADLGISEQAIYSWRRQDRIDRGLEAGLTTVEKAELVAARRRIRELEAELAVHRRATELLKEQAGPQGGSRPSMGSIGDCYDNAAIESFWSRMQVELLDPKHWRTRIELANAIFEHLEIFHNRQRRHSALGMLTPVEYEADYQPTTRHESSLPTPPNPGHPQASTNPGRFTHS